MKSKYVLLASALLISVSNFAQKNEIKAAEKALKSGNAAEARTLLQQAEPLLTAATDAEKAQFLFVKGNIALDLATKNIETSKNLSEAAKAFQDLIAAEKATGKSKYTSQATTSISDIKNKLVNSAVEKGTAKNYKEAAALLKQVYDLDTTDLEKLYYAASYAVNGGDYETSLAYYNELKNKNYSGEGTSYYAKSLITDQEEMFGTKAERDKMVMLKSHKEPRDEKIPSKKGEIYKNIALIYVQQGKNEEAKKSLSEARAANPDDTSLAMAEADLYLKLEDYTMYKKIVTEVLEKNPNDADLLYNLGVISSKTNGADAEAYYKRAIAIKPDYTNAYLNLAILKLDGEKTIIDEMNKLGTSEKDNKRYEVLKSKREGVFKEALPYLEKAYQLNPANEDVSATLLNVYGALEMTAEKKALKAKLGK
ncbi:MAG: tetratricopeptide repeat protein [Flavobacterium sp.]|uniref:tetratricopeptide repeat protein n=1 Tax=Flavobacterium sp. TaxID=239 RepID=UPI0022BAD444|nr:tetratricopeptide repeat protein [Flavobacterium sp.]MCZ8198538.1 tetratricopeptide repeat protein [Flavobacterium sp.]